MLNIFFLDVGRLETIANNKWEVRDIRQDSCTALVSLTLSRGNLCGKFHTPPPPVNGETPGIY